MRNCFFRRPFVTKSGNMMRSKLEYQSLQSQIDELAGKIIVRQRDNESALRAQHGAIEKNEGKVYSYRFSAKTFQS